MNQYDYVEEEYFISGTANVYGPGVKRGPLGEHETAYELDALGALAQADVPYKTRILVIRPRDPANFSGNIHSYPFHNVIARSEVQEYLLRGGDAWIGSEVCSGTRFGAQEIPSGGVAHLHKVDPQRYGAAETCSHWHRIQRCAARRRSWAWPHPWSLVSTTPGGCKAQMGVNPR